MAGGRLFCSAITDSIQRVFERARPAIGLPAVFSDRNWTTGEQYIQQVLAINPNRAIAHAWYGNIRRVQEKVAAPKQSFGAWDLDLLNPGFNNLAEACPVGGSPVAV